MNSQLYVVTKAGMSNLAKGVFTNRQELYNAFIAEFKTHKISFIHVLGYENKKFNYINVRNLLKTLEVNESFHILIESESGKQIFEVTIKAKNQLTV